MPAVAADERPAPEAMEPPEGAHCARHPRRPAVEHCPTCGDHLCADCALRPCEAADCPHAAEGDCLPPVPWEDGARLGWARAWGLTLAAVARDPVRFFRRLPHRGGLTAPLAFATVCFTLGAAAVLLGVAAPELPGAALPLGLLLCTLPFVGLYRAAGTGLLIWAGIGVLERDPPPLRGVLRLTAYSLASDLLLPAAGLGVYAAAALQALALRRGWGVAWWKAVLVACLPLSLFHLGVLGALALYLAISGQRI